MTTSVPEGERTGKDQRKYDERYVDTGCDIYHACLQCPLPKCRYDMPPKQAQAILQAIRLRALMRDYGDHGAGQGQGQGQGQGHGRGRRPLTAAEAAARLSVSRRTVFRLKEWFPKLDAWGV